MPEQKAFAYYRCANALESSIAIQKRHVQEYSRSMHYEIISEITAQQPLDEAQAQAICRVIRQEMHIFGPIKLLVMNLKRLNRDLYMVHRISDVFSRHGITLESVTKTDQEILALSDQVEYEFMQALSGTGMSAF